MTTEPDDYPDLPPLSLAARLSFQSLEPEHFALSPDESAELVEVARAVRAHVKRYLGHLGDETVEMSMCAACMAIRDTLTAALNGNGDVTPHD